MRGRDLQFYKYKLTDDKTEDSARSYFVFVSKFVHKNQHYTIANTSNLLYQFKTVDSSIP